MIELFVGGEPITQGSKTAIMPKGATRPVVIEAGGPHRQKHAAWRTDVKAAAQRWQDEHHALHAGKPPLLTGPLVVRVAFGMPRPASASKTERTWPIKARSGDVDKLARSVLDALTNVLFADDSQVVKLIVDKDWGDPPGAHIKVWTMDEWPPRAAKTGE